MQFDFQDGNGPVPAHQHKNGEGWVADTATVDDRVYVGRSARVSGEALVFGKAQVCGEAQVYGNARVYGKARVFGKARVCGNAQVYGNARVCGGKWEISPFWSQVGRFSIGVSRPGYIMAGCQEHPIEVWQERAEEIARNNNATEEEIGMGLALLPLLIQFAKKGK